MTITREQLEKAAKAAGIEIEKYQGDLYLRNQLMDNVGSRATISDVAYLTGLSVAYPDVKKLIDAIEKYRAVELYCEC